MSRFGGRFVPNIENEVRRQARESVSSWRQEWVLPSANANTKTGGGGVTDGAGVRILKWVKVADNRVAFAEDDDVRVEDRIQNDAAILEAPVQSIHNAPVEHVPTNKLSMSGGLGTIAPREPPPLAAPVTAASVEPVAQSELPADSSASAVPPSATSDVLAAPMSVATASALLANDSASVESTPGADISQAVSAGDGPSGTQTPQIQPQVEAQLNNTTNSATDLPEGVNDSATLAVLATAGDSNVAQDSVTEMVDPTEPGQATISIETGAQAANIQEIPPAQQEQPVVQPPSHAHSTDVEMKDA